MAGFGRDIPSEGFEKWINKRLSEVGLISRDCAEGVVDGVNLVIFKKLRIALAPVLECCFETCRSRWPA